MNPANECSRLCGGKCCEDFPLNVTPERLGELYVAAQAAIVAGEPHDEEIVFIAEMLIRIDEPDESRPRYTCAHLRRDGLCGVYDRRPAMCRDYPGYGRGWPCRHCGFRQPLPTTHQLTRGSTP